MSELDNLRQAIAALEAQRPQLGDAVVEAALGPLRARQASLEAEMPLPAPERKYVSIMFVDVVGSTRLEQGLDPEDIASIMGAAMRRFTAVISAHGGQVLRYMGDGLMAIFGVPVATEADAERAVSAGLALLGEARAYAPIVESRWGLKDFKVRVGINTGQVLIDGPGAENTAMGMTTNLAARMETSAPADGLLISHDTYQHVADLFDVEPQPPLHVKGRDEPIQTYVVNRPRSAGKSVRRRGIAGHEVPVIGRDKEVGQLTAFLDDTIERSRTRIVTVVGGPGVGKTRLLEDLAARAKERHPELLHLTGHASHELASTPYGLLRKLLAHRFAILDSDIVSEVRRKVETGLVPYLSDEPQMKAHFIGAMLGFPFSDSPHLVGVKGDPEQLHNRALFYLSQYLRALDREAPILVVLQDIHWADDASITAIKRLARELPDLRMLILCSARNRFYEAHPDWDRETSGLEDTVLVDGARFELRPLANPDTRRLVATLLDGVDGVPDSLLDLVAETAGGNPYYVEELVRMLASDGIIKHEPGVGRWQVEAARLSGLRVPPTLMALLQARLDSLPPEERLTLQQASVAGRTFWGRMLAAMGERADPPAGELVALERRELIGYQAHSSFEDTDEYEFGQALMRDVSYETLLKGLRQRYHAAAGDWLVEATQASGRTGEYAPAIAAHFELGGSAGRAASWYAQAGELAVAQGAFSTARDLFERALSLAPESDIDTRLRGLFGMNEVMGILGDLEARLSLDDRLIAVAQESGDDNVLARAYLRRAYSLSLIGDERGALPVYDLAQQAAARAGNRQLMLETLPLKATSLTRLGELELASSTALEAERLLEAPCDAITLARALTNLSNFYGAVGDLARAARQLERQVAITHELGNRFGLAIGLSNLGYHYVQLGLSEEGIRALREAKSICDMIGARQQGAYAQLNLGLALLRAGTPAEGKELLTGLCGFWATTGDTFGAAANHVYLGLCLEHTGELAAARASFMAGENAFSGGGMMGFVEDAAAGQARCLLDGGDLEPATMLANRVWSYLAQYGPKSLEFPILAYNTCRRVFWAAGDPVSARDALVAGYQELVARSERISEPEWRVSFLENILEHRELQRAWQKATA